MLDMIKKPVFQILLVDTLIGLATYIGARFLSPDDIKWALGVWALLQPLVYAIIKGQVDMEVELHSYMLHTQAREKGEVKF